ncbi:similar to Saccharomyces cerevisiae YBR076W ECM8 Non-essential protein of unknown function [Maudiozyma saulgeensis]|uniref:Uncharacterized protein n=1 Tax=Maudiozyma saulgeensis TaxID=1789683 RepID=A0A1X7R889_9SACH|nr:similar to Saccharomyces cerevisiae YBR076W ECM8 Non-essential protein of unknown function [Kazachstania saulgeensis]
MLEEQEQLLINPRIFNDITNVSNNSNNKKTSQILPININYQFNEDKIYCKDNLEILKKRQDKILLPRVFQHHSLPNWLIKRYKEINNNCEFFINKEKNNESPCNSLRQENIQEEEWIQFKYFRKINSINQILCRYCYGKNWINELFIYEHLFGSHGIVTRQNNEKINIRLLPLPERYQIIKVNSKLVKIQVLCRECQRWIQLNDTNNNNSKKDSIEYRQLHGIRGFYENYFRHYISCKESEHNQIHFISK